MPVQAAAPDGVTRWSWPAAGLLAAGAVVTLVAAAGVPPVPPPLPPVPSQLPASSEAVAAQEVPPSVPAPGAAVAEPPAVAGLPRSRPVRLDVDRAGVHTPLVTLGLQPDGTVEVPPLRSDAPAGWYRYLASPGEPGPAVILGHVDTRSGPAVFHRLGVLRRGDLVRVTRQDGRVVRFRVTDVVLVAKSAFPTQAVYGATVLPTLRLVTCGGTFDRRAHSYTGNTVVFASWEP